MILYVHRNGPQWSHWFSHCDRFPASTACNRRPQVFLYPQQSIVLRIEPVCLGISGTQTCILPCFSKKKEKKEEAFTIITTATKEEKKKTSVSRPGQSNNGQASRCDYREPTVSLPGRWRCALSECSRKATESKKFHWSSIPWEGDPHRNFSCPISHTAWNEKWFLTLKAGGITGFYLERRKRRNPNKWGHALGGTQGMREID